MIEARSSERPQLRIERAFRLCSIAAENLDIGLGAQRDEAIGRPLSGMNPAIERPAIQPVGEMRFALRQIRSVPDEMIDPHALAIAYRPARSPRRPRQRWHAVKRSGRL